MICITDAIMDMQPCNDTWILAFVLCLFYASDFGQLDTLSSVVPV